MNDLLELPGPLVFSLLGAAAWSGEPDAAQAPAAILAPAARRRATPLERAVAEVAGQVLGGLATSRDRVRMVLGSRFGELAATRAILESLTHGDGRVSPTAFSSSVHNASLGLVSIALGIRAGSVAVSGGEATAYLALLEAAALLREEDAPVLVILADEGPQASLGQPGAFTAGALAVLLARARPRRAPAGSASLVVNGPASAPSQRTAPALRERADEARPRSPSGRDVGVHDRDGPAWWPLREAVWTAAGDTSDASQLPTGPQLAAALTAMPYELATGARQGRTRASLRVFAGDAETGLTDAFVALPHDPPARVVGFPAWTIEQGLVCSIVPTRADPFVVQAARVEDPAVDPRRAVALPHAPAVDAIACLEWIAQAAAWWGHVAAPGEEARPAVAQSGAVLATRELRLARRWLSVGETYRVIVRCVGRARGLARFEGIVTCERGRCVASADLLVRTSGDLDGVVGGEKPPHRA